jgi:hypothetical protein
MPNICNEHTISRGFFKRQKSGVAGPSHVTILFLYGMALRGRFVDRPESAWNDPGGVVNRHCTRLPIVSCQAVAVTIFAQLLDAASKPSLES